MVIHGQNRDFVRNRHRSFPRAAFDPLPSRVFPVAYIGDLGWDRNIDLGTGARFAPYVQTCADVSSAFPHSEQSPMAIPAAAQNLLVYAAAIISHSHA